MAGAIGEGEAELMVLLQPVPFAILFAGHRAETQTKDSRFVGLLPDSYTASRQVMAAVFWLLRLSHPGKSW